DLLALRATLVRANDHRAAAEGVHVHRLAVAALPFGLHALDQRREAEPLLPRIEQHDVVEALRAVLEEPPHRARGRIVLLLALENVLTALLLHALAAARGRVMRLLRERGIERHDDELELRQRAIGRPHAPLRALHPSRLFRIEHFAMDLLPTNFR